MGRALVDIGGGPWGAAWDHWPRGAFHGRSRGKRHGMPHMINRYGMVN